MDVLGLKQGRQRYGLFTGEDGGILDDLMFANRGDHLFAVVNAACKADDIAHMKTALEPDLSVTPVTCVAGVKIARTRVTVSPSSRTSSLRGV